LIYLDTSVYLRILLGDKNSLKLKSNLPLTTSELFFIEVNRTLDRIRLEGKVSDLQLSELKRDARLFSQSVEVFELEERVRLRATEAFPTVVKTLDSLHLATALLIREHTYPDLQICTQDDPFARCAQALGFDVIRA